MHIYDKLGAYCFCQGRAKFVITHILVEMMIYAMAMEIADGKLVIPAWNRLINCMNRYM